MKLAKVALLAVSLSLGGCTSVASVVSSVATSLSSSTSRQVTTFAEAEQAATIVTKAADVYVTSGMNIPAAQLREIQSLSNGIHAALVNLQAAQAHGQSLNFASFNAALEAYNAYATNIGISH